MLQLLSWNIYLLAFLYHVRRFFALDELLHSMNYSNDTSAANYLLFLWQLKAKEPCARIQ